MKENAMGGVRSSEQLKLQQHCLVTRFICILTFPHSVPPLTCPIADSVFTAPFLV